MIVHSQGSVLVRPRFGVHRAGRGRCMCQPDRTLHGSIRTDTYLKTANRRQPFSVGFVSRQIDHEAPTPPYRQIAEDIRGQIERGELAAGRRVPSEKDITDTYGVARTTARRAVAALREAGLVTTTAGRGTYVVPTDQRPNS
jgi:GntR family transcriptional regulator